VNVNPEYPWGDRVWLASDSVGHVAALVSAGQGPVPRDAVANRFLDFFLIEDVLQELPVRGDVDVVRREYAAESFVEIGKRGLFVFDWSDVHAFTEGLDAYEKCVWPSHPIHISELPSPLKEVAGLVQLNELSFSDAAWAKPQLFYDCLNREH
jgi:hypothetical protein